LVGVTHVKLDPLVPAASVIQNPLSVVVHISSSAAANSAVSSVWLMLGIPDFGHVSVPHTSVVWNPLA